MAGDPTAEEIAALVLALDAAAAVDAKARRRPAPPAWLQAARMEGLGHRPAVAPADLVDHGR
ncbi:MAG: acyl-CoA carboxylase epsilon subunit [Egibacteraceae bacterium]